MYSLGTKIKMFFIGLLLAVVAVAAKSIENPEQEPYSKNQIEFANRLTDDGSRDLQLFKYLLTNALFSRQPSPYDWEDQQRKRSYWKQCAFNAVSCFGKK